MFAWSKLLCSLGFNRGLLTCRVNRAVFTARQASTFCYSSVKEQVSGSSITSSRLIDAKTCDSSLTVHWQDGKARFHNIWLRHHCPCEQCLSPHTKQKLVNMALIPDDIHPQEVKTIDDKIRITWNDSHESVFQADWLKDNAYDEVYKNSDRSEFSIADGSRVLLWNRETIARNPPPEFSFEELLKRDPDLEFHFLDTIVRYGFTFVTNTPLDAESLTKICKIMGGFIQDTFVGRVYKLENKELTHSDLSYLNVALAAHTDHTFGSPPGIQIMHCTYHNGTGGASLLVDGFLAAKTLHQEDPEAFKILTSTEVPFEHNSKDLCIRGHGPLIELDPFTGAVAFIRYNNSRVGTFNKLNLRYEDMQKFYRAVKCYGAILRRPEHELWFKLSPGRVTVMYNRRILHGRSELTGKRVIEGCYVTLDDFMGRWRARKNQRK